MMQKMVELLADKYISLYIFLAIIYMYFYIHILFTYLYLYEAIKCRALGTNARASLEAHEAFEAWQPSEQQIFS